MLEEPEDSGTTQKEDVKKTPAIMLPSILSITLYVYYTHFRFQAHSASKSLHTLIMQDHNPWLYRGPKLEQRTLGVGEQVIHRFF